VLVLVGAVLVAGYLQATKPTLEPKQPEEREWLIAAVTAQIADIQPDIAAFGEVVAQRDVELRALVAGQVVDIGDNFVDGGIVRAGDLLVAIDPFDSNAALAESEASLLEAKALLAETEADISAEEAGLTEERTQLAIAEREMERRKDLVARGIASEKALDDASMVRSERARATALGERRLVSLRARAARQQAAITRSDVAVKRAKRDLENARLLAPFDGYLTETSAALGKRLAVNDRVVRLLGLERLEARVHLSDAEYGRLVSSARGIFGRSVDVVWRAGTQRFSYNAVIGRVGGEFDAASGGVTVYARISNAGPDGPLRPGAFVEVEVPDRVYRQATRLPETALVGGDTVYAVVGDRLEPRLVELLARVGNDVVVQGEIADGETIATTRFPEIGPGVKVRVR
jgi:RND family efflux transporter MFP subunit